MFKAVIFDADGMMILGDRPSQRLARDYGVPKEDISKFFDNEFKGCVLGQRDLKEEVAPYLKLWGWKGTMDEFLHFWFAESYRVDEKLAKAVRDLRAKGIKCLLATNQEKYRVAYMRNEMGFETLFGAVVVSSEVGAKKPDALVFDALMKCLPDIEKSEVLFWDDREENIKAAREYGFQARLFSDADDFCVTMELSR